MKKLVCMLTLTLVVGSAVTAEAQRRQRRQGRGGFNFRGGFGGFGGGGSPLDLLARKDVQKELDLLEDQIKEGEELRSKRQDMIREAFTGGRGQGGGRRERGGGGGADRFARLRETMEKVTKEINEELDEILLPHQKKRLDQLALQRQLRGASGSARALSRGDLAEKLNISEDQGEKLTETARKIDAETQKQIAQLQIKARNKLLAALKPSQKEKVEEMLGKAFVFDENERSRRGFGGFGGRGGGRRGGGGRPERPQRPGRGDN